MKSKVYFLKADRLNELGAFLKRADTFWHVKAKQFLALKIHFGEKGVEGFIKPKYVKTVAEIVRQKTAFPFLTDSSTLYNGWRADAYHHLLIANKHGFNIENCACPVIIADGLKGNGQVCVDVNLKHFKKIFIAPAIFDCGGLIFLSHAKGHALTGFAGALKNIAMGCAAKEGKRQMHKIAVPIFDMKKCQACFLCIKNCPVNALYFIDDKINVDEAKCLGCGRCASFCQSAAINILDNESSKILQERIAEYVFGILKNKNASYVNFLMHVTPYCDCHAKANNKPLIADIGVLASKDPVSIDQASCDLIKNECGVNDICNIFHKIDESICLDYAQSLGLGKREYELIRF
ncbi:MAG: DUF362 domain-containing protein [Elusimicrobiota bacterium]|jgi:uncharacterized Fe-S center protein|nr:DUF362 domain-containing protein [Elusimicrobiota bacterium]